MTRTPEDLVRDEVHYCISALVSTLAQGVNFVIERHDQPFTELTYQAAELCAPIDDWEEAAIQAGWRQRADGAWINPDKFPAAVAAKPEHIVEDWQPDLEPYQREVFEHWIISDWLADKLEAKGERIDRDFAGLTVWGRTTTGQAIAMDSVIEAIHAELVADRCAS